jgi:hypothetical protein
MAVSAMIVSTMAVPTLVGPAMVVSAMAAPALVVSTVAGMADVPLVLHLPCSSHGISDDHWMRTRHGVPGGSPAVDGAEYTA